MRPSVPQRPRRPIAGFFDGVRGLPRQFWLLLVGSWLFNLAFGIGLPNETIYLADVRHVSTASIGLLFGLATFGALPTVVGGGWLADARGRRGLLAFSVCSVFVFYLGMALSQELWQFALCVFIEGLFGWPLFLTAANSMTADLVAEERRREAYGLLRLSMYAGFLVGSSVASVAVANGVSYQALFLSAALASLLFVALIGLRIRETRPDPRTQEAPTDNDRGVGYRRVFSDRRFLLFGLVALLPLFCVGQFLWILPLFLRRVLDASPSLWDGSLALYTGVSAVLQYPMMRFLRHFESMKLLALSSALLGIGVGAVAFLRSSWPVLLLVVVYGVGECILWPVSSTVVAQLAPLEERGHYIGAWSLASSAGSGFGPLIGGWSMAQLGARRSFFVLLLAGMAGAGLFPLLRSRSHPLEDGRRSEV